MTKSKIRKLLSILLGLVAAVCLVLGAVNLPKQNNAAGEEILQKLRIYTLLNATGDSVVESYVSIAKAEAQEAARASGGGMAAIREAVAKAEEETRALYSDSAQTDYSQIDTTGLSAAVTVYTEAVKAYADAEAEARAAYEEAHYEEAQAALEAKHEEMLAAGEEIPEDEEVVVDMSGFEPTPEMIQKLEEAGKTYENVGKELKAIYPVLTDEALETLEDTVQGILYQSGDSFSTQYDRYMEQSNAPKTTGNSLIRHADDMIYLAVALVVVAVLLLFYELLVAKLGIPRVIIGVFFILLCFMTLWYDLSLPTLLSNTVVRMGMNSIMVLAMVPGIQCGISLNLGLPIGLVAGLIGGLLTIELGIPGWGGFLFAIVVGSLLAAVCGYLYGLLLNRLKGDEMSVTTYVGFSIVSLMCIAWLVLPFTSLKLRWPLGTGLRNTIGLDSTNFKHILNNFLAFNIGSFAVPTGLLLFMVLSCVLVWLFTRSKTGEAMQAVGNNPRFAESTGINVDKMRIIGTVLSTVIGAIGILVYSQSYGFMQLYTAPRQMGFIAASAILIGGASTSRCKISHVLIGTFLFQGVLTLGMPVANVLVPGSTISETLRILISNGIILYALTKSGGDSRA
ncbi:ABC transporter permease [Lacrimispora sp. 210928-DFI.3.58]|uniref:ABC transporter permease n=1 Tax=Lacrimispora sp. 210928-DFI.3.58 TaxID=2883214 RepID=UPI001D0729EA|nr:ABC transporter permease [Lacrimispora sp. 210928-DFI.3.58]MCB7320411.1 ABC transporter permease [Lacrimispora sp. 210928-DFI.3.58]